MFENNKLSIYIHYPFCLSKCPYCDFNSYKINTNFEEDKLIEAYLKELKYYAELLKNKQINTIFFGGGTPSLMSINMLEKILNCINKFWHVDVDAEISIEANPTSVESQKFEKYKTLGINRLSLGVQSFDENDLKFLGRMHSVDDAKQAILLAQKYFNEHYSVDLIYARPKQKLDDWLKELKEIVEFSPFHISLYQLIIVENTKFFDLGVKSLNDDEATIMYEETNKFLESKNIFRYEVSNYAKNGFECKHNSNYWNSGEWLGIGAGAHGRICFKKDETKNYKTRTNIENFDNVNEWIDSVDKNGFGAKNVNLLTENEFKEEILLMGLRTKNGINIDNVKKYLHINDMNNVVLDKNNIVLLKNLQYIDLSYTNLKINEKYFNILDSIIEKLI